jgi:hypothetical protein
MAVVDITLKLPEDLVRDAREFDMLTDQTVAGLLEAEVNRRVMDLVNADIHAYRAEKAQRQKDKLPSSSFMWSLIPSLKTAGVGQDVCNPQKAMDSQRISGV